LYFNFQKVNLDAAEKKPDRTLGLNQKLEVFLFRWQQALIAPDYYLALIRIKQNNLEERFPSYSNFDIEGDSIITVKKSFGTTS